jgi:hypothetical protein
MVKGVMPAVAVEATPSQFNRYWTAHGFDPGVFGVHRLVLWLIVNSHRCSDVPVLFGGSARSSVGNCWNTAPVSGMLNLLPEWRARAFGHW